MLMDVLHDVRVREDAVSGEQAHRSPGLLEKHYSPRAPLTLYEGPDAVSLLLHDAHVACETEERVGLLVAPDDLPPGDDLRRRCIVREIGPDAPAVARNLYAVLRELDASHVNVILARAFPTDDGLGAAIHDRLRRAAAGRVVCR
jgi:L-threonylcarbamoyladenylate synthase